MSFSARGKDFMGHVGNLPRVGNPPLSAAGDNAGGRLSQFAACRYVLLSIAFFARCDELGVVRVVGQAGSLRPIVNRPNVANVQHSWFAACRYAGQDVILRAGCQPAPACGAL
jgi:hypothetical protein